MLVFCATMSADSRHSLPGSNQTPTSTSADHHLGLERDALDVGGASTLAELDLLALPQVPADADLLGVADDLKVPTTVGEDAEADHVVTGLELLPGGSDVPGGACVGFDHEGLTGLHGVHVERLHIFFAGGFAPGLNGGFSHDGGSPVRSRRSQGMCAYTSSGLLVSLIIILIYIDNLVNILYTS